MNKINLGNLLAQVNLIKKKFDSLAEYTGENYNIFNVLNIYSDELSHSKIIGNLLNAKGKHGQEDIFLKLFLKELPAFQENSEQYKVLDSFQSRNSKSFVERHIGKVDIENEIGGRIDILLNDGKNNIIIENKVWANDGFIQLVRYNNNYKTAPIIYLTLDGSKPSDQSKGDLILDKDFICLSYENDIIRWVENCIKEMVNKPIIRESLNQYLILLKQLTNQITNNKMKEEIINLILQNEANLSSFMEIQNLNKDDFYKTIIQNNLISDIEKIAQDLNLNVHYNEDDLLLQKGWPGFYFDNDKLKMHDIKIHFSANKSLSFSDVIYGITSSKNDLHLFEKMQIDFRNMFKYNKPVNHWKCKTDYSGYKNFNDLIVLQKIYNGEFKKDLVEKVKLIQEIVERNLDI